MFLSGRTGLGLPFIAGSRGNQTTGSPDLIKTTPEARTACSYHRKLVLGRTFLVLINTNIFVKKIIRLHLMILFIYLFIYLFIIIIIIIIIIINNYYYYYYYYYFICFDNWRSGYVIG